MFSPVAFAAANAVRLNPHLTVEELASAVAEAVNAAEAAEGRYAEAYRIAQRDDPGGRPETWACQAGNILAELALLEPVIA